MITWKQAMIIWYTRRHEYGFGVNCRDYSMLFLDVPYDTLRRMTDKCLLHKNIDKTMSIHDGQIYYQTSITGREALADYQNKTGEVRPIDHGWSRARLRFFHIMNPGYPDNTNPDQLLLFGDKR